MVQGTGYKKKIALDQGSGMADLPTQLLDWYAVHARDLPWRRGHLPYHIWISEMMLQQTRIERAVDYFHRWVRRFPDIVHVAAAAEDEVLKHWEGLGYYSRARRIKETAGILVSLYGGRLPADHQALLDLPGIGPYTAGAIMSLAFNEKYPVVDANVERLFARIFNIKGPVKEKKNRRFIWRTAGELIPDNQARNFNQALMELGALVCGPKNPGCPSCPVDMHCESRRLGISSQRPVPPRHEKIVRIDMATGVLIHRGRIFIQKRPAKGVWANLWEFPGGRLESGETPEQALVREYCEETGFSIGRLQKIKVIRHSYTKYRVTLSCYFCRLLDGAITPCLHAAQDYRWITPAQLDDFAFPAPHRHLIAFMRDQGLLGA